MDHSSKEKRWQVVDSAGKRPRFNASSRSSSWDFEKEREKRSNQKIRNSISEDINLQLHKDYEISRRKVEREQDFCRGLKLVRRFCTSLAERRNHPTSRSTSKSAAGFRRSKSPSSCFYEHDRVTGLLRRSFSPSPVKSRSRFSTHDHRYSEPIKHHDSHKSDRSYQKSRALSRETRRHHSTTRVSNVNSSGSFLTSAAHLSSTSARFPSNSQFSKSSRSFSSSRLQRFTRSSFSPSPRRSHRSPLSSRLKRFSRSSSSLHFRECSHRVHLSTRPTFCAQMNRGKRDFDRTVEYPQSRKVKQCRRQSANRSGRSKSSSETSPEKVSLDDESTRISSDDLQEYKYHEVLIDVADGACVQIPCFASSESDKDNESQSEDDSSVTSERSFATVTDAEIYTELYNKKQKTNNTGSPKHRSKSFSLQAHDNLIALNTNDTFKQKSKSMEMLISKPEAEETIIDLKSNLLTDIQINNTGRKQLSCLRSTLNSSDAMSPLTLITNLKRCNSSPSDHFVNVAAKSEAATDDKVMAKSVSVTDLSKVLSTEKKNFKTLRNFTLESRNSSKMQLTKKDYSESKLRSRKRCRSLPPRAYDSSVGKPTTIAFQPVMPLIDVISDVPLMAENDISKAVCCLLFGSLI